MIDLSGRTLLNTQEAAIILNLKPQTLYFWSSRQCGPIQSVHIGRSIKWRVIDIIGLIG